MKKSILSAFALIIAVNIMAQNNDTLQVNTSDFVLQEVTVESKNVIQKVDKQVLLPNREQRKASSDGVSLLQHLQIPRIVVNQADNTVKTLSNDDVQLRINGIEATTAEVMAINPKDVIRIEYHDQPGVRYNGAAAVIDYIVRHRDTGGSLMLNASNGVTMPGWGEYYLSGKIHFGKSSLSLLSQYSPRDIYWTRTNTEAYHFSTGTIENSEVGAPTRYKKDPVNLALNYNWANGDKNMLNITLRDNMAFTPYAQTNRDSRLYQGTDSFTVHDHESSTAISPALDIYYQHNLPEDNHIYLNVVGTYLNTRLSRQFTQAPLGNTIADTTDVVSSVRGNKYSLIGEAIYEKRWEKVALTAGLRHNQQWMNNDYHYALVDMTTAETYAFAEVQQRIGHFAYAAGLGAMHTYISQAEAHRSNWIARPQLTMSYDFGKGVFLKYKGYISGYQPSLAQMSDVSQQIDKYQIRRGNPGLKPVMFVANELNLSWQSKFVSLDLWANYSYDHRPIMDESYEEQVEGMPMVIRTYANQRGFHRLRVTPSLQVRLLQNRLMFTVAPFANYYVSQGNAYTHTHFNPGVRASVMGMYNGWVFSADVTTRYNNLWSETLEYGEFYHTLNVGYNADLRGPQRAGSHGVSGWGFRVMMMNPFSVKGYSIDLRDLSAIAPNTMHAEMKDFHQTLILNFHCNLDFGTRRNDAGKRINNEDTDNGILSATK